MKNLEFKTPEDWTGIFIPDLINEWHFSNPLWLTSRDDEGLNTAEFHLRSYIPKGWSTFSTGLITPNESPRYNKIKIMVNGARFNEPKRENMVELLGYLEEFKEDYSFDSVTMLANVGSGNFREDGWTMRLSADTEKVVLESLGHHENDKDAQERTANYAIELQRRGLELLSEEELVM
tara:strand:- start:30 stop:563 length:534 start_codon:yes stop_codon:yes gene_type:complete